MNPAPARLVLPSERHVERLSRGGILAGETRSRLRARLLDALAPAVVFAPAEQTRMALAHVLSAIAESDALLGPLARAGGTAWLRTIDAMDAAMGALRAACVDEAALAAVERGGTASSARARLLRRTMKSLDDALAARHRVDGRAAGDVLAQAIEKADPRRVREAAGGARFVARWIVAWDASDLAWWRALDAALARAGGGGAIIELPASEGPLDAERDRAPLEVVAFEVARGLDAAPHGMNVDAPLGDLSLQGDIGDAAKARIELRRGVDARAQARAIADAVHDAIGRGVPIDRIAVALPRVDEETLEPIRVAFEDAGIVSYEPRGRAPAGSSLVAFALGALGAASRGLARAEIAALLRSHHIDRRRASFVTANVAPQDAEAIDGVDEDAATRACEKIARTLDETAPVRHDDPIASLAATAGDDPHARALGELLAKAELAKTRAEHVAAARAIWAGLGLRPRTPSRVARALATDEGATTSLVRAELAAVARDARAWQVLHDAVDAYERAASDLHLATSVVTSEAFRHELARVLEAAPPPPGASRAGAVRIARMAELAGEPLALLIVADANDGVLPQAPPPAALIGETLVLALRKRVGVAPPAPHVRAARELAELFVAVAAAEEIVLAYRDEDDAGALLAPAPVTAWLARAGVRETRWGASPIAGAPRNAREATLRALAGGADADAIAPRAARLARIERARESLFEGDRSPSPIRGHLEHDDARARILSDETGGGDRALAVTALERMATCRFQGFAAHVLGAREPVVVADAPDARETGTLVHEALAAAFRATRDLWRARPRDRETILARGLAAADRALDAVHAAGALRRLVLTRARADVAAVLEWTLADLAWDFDRAEQSFGAAKGDSWPAFTLGDAATRVRLRGTIDRVDVAHDRAAVRALDYKTSRSAADEAGRALGESTFQAAVYAAVAAEHHGAKEREGAYLPARASVLTSDFTRSKSHDAAWAAAHVETGGAIAFAKRALAVVREMREGALAPIPEDERACARCSYDGGCRKPRFTIARDDDG